MSPTALGWPVCQTTNSVIYRWGAGTFAGGDGSRQPTEKEIQLATHQGKVFYQAVAKVNFST